MSKGGYTPSEDRGGGRTDNGYNGGYDDRNNNNVSGNASERNYNDLYDKNDYDRNNDSNYRNDQDNGRSNRGYNENGSSNASSPRASNGNGGVLNFGPDPQSELVKKRNTQMLYAQQLKVTFWLFHR
jgi:hypothetical protein